ncbi:MAG TPA: hypothetical protein VD907_07015 [Verrucomicrobiae bacterium]|nr:hypothetical protein [Verrucomicrobiae bacterium]
MEAVIFIGLVVVAITQIIKMFVPAVNGAVTIIVALIVGAVVGALDQVLGVTDVTIAEGIAGALNGIGLSTLAGKAGGGTAGDGDSRVVSRG